PFMVLSRGETLSFADAATQLGLPMFVKPANQGSSVGVSKVSDEAGFVAALALGFEFDHKLLIEQGIVGREVECAVLGNFDAQV
ncbi:D-alanine--D-alanine ligase A, partial [Escherichia coli]|nr:D-alanine--D-alanine ligase A [Escherichia coli]